MNQYFKPTKENNFHFLCPTTLLVQNRGMFMHVKTDIVINAICMFMASQSIQLAQTLTLGSDLFNYLLNSSMWISQKVPKFSMFKTKLNNLLGKIYSLYYSLYLSTLNRYPSTKFLIITTFFLFPVTDISK